MTKKVHNHFCFKSGVKVLAGYNYTSKIKGHIRFEEPSQKENIVIVAQENFNSVDPRESLLNLDEVIRHEPRGSAKVKKKRDFVGKDVEQQEGKGKKFVYRTNYLPHILFL